MDQVLSMAQFAYSHNQYAPDMALAVSATLTGSKTAPSGTYSRFYGPAVSGPMPWNYYGGEPVLDDWGIRLMSATFNAGSQQRIGQIGTIETILDGDEVIFMVEAGYTYTRILVKEEGAMKFVNVDGMGAAYQSGSGQAYYKLTFPTRQHRTIQLEIARLSGLDDTNLCRFGGAYVKDDNQLFRPSSDNLRLIGVGDSMIMSVNGPPGDGYLRTAMNHLGLKDVWISGVQASGSYTGYITWANRRNDWIMRNPQLIAFTMSWTDVANIDEGAGHGVAYMTNLVMTEVSAARTALPDCIILMISLCESFDYDGSPGWKTYNASMKAAIEGLGDNYIRFVDMMSGPEAALTGIGNGNGGTGGNESIYNNGHWTRDGDQHVGLHAANRTLDALRLMYYGASVTQVTQPPIDTELDPQIKSRVYFEGPNDSTVITDDAGLVWQAVGSNAKLSTNSPIAGTSSGRITNADSYFETVSAAPALGTGDFTIQIAYQAEGAVVNTGNATLLCAEADSNGGYSLIASSGDPLRGIYFYGANGLQALYAAGLDITDGSVHVITAQREGGTTSIYVDTNRIAQAADSTNYTPIAGAKLAIGRRQAHAEIRPMIGKVDRLQIKIGGVIYSGSPSTISP